ncbi:hypothetical protein L1987_09296 [Smallanthus sonchifolius]|uniref:Uncharacterized protein n=1 Tax=Smallanthus sonchifolius TaxID=185202 RepID=A0ACB9JMK7_9ASTR|nr:hypothetical protein L1987_09296 [Smallanthus sonchifolius]
MNTFSDGKDRGGGVNGVGEWIRWWIEDSQATVKRAGDDDKDWGANTISRRASQWKQLLHGGARVPKRSRITRCLLTPIYGLQGNDIPDLGQT